jgi:hypothetical protein
VNNHPRFPSNSRVVDRLIRAYQELDSPFFALSLLVNEFAWDHDARQRFIQRALLVRAPGSP